MQKSGQLTAWVISVLGGQINGKGRRSKGATGEREFLKVLGDKLKDLGFPVPEGGFQRNLEQTRHGGFDNHNEDCLSHFAIEIRRREQLSLGAWWTDVCCKAGKLNRLPVIAYRQNRQPWKIVLPFYFDCRELVCPEELDYGQEPITMDLDGFCRILNFLHTRGRL